MMIPPTKICYESPNGRHISDRVQQAAHNFPALFADENRHRFARETRQQRMPLTALAAKKRREPESWETCGQIAR
jgi:hypothetical protein